MPYHWTNLSDFCLLSEHFASVSNDKHHPDVDGFFNGLPSPRQSHKHRNVLWLPYRRCFRRDPRCNSSLPPFLSILAGSTTPVEAVPLERRDPKDVPRVDLLNNWANFSSGNLFAIKIIIIMEHSMQLDTACSIQIFIICAAANYFLSRYAFMTIIIGGALGFARYVALYCYKLGSHCFGPFNFWYFIRSYQHFGYTSSNNHISCKWCRLLLSCS